MNEFVDECRDEWRRLGVPDRVADEMAADLAADLEEAASEGASAEEVLGSAAYDARAFAAAWASERGLVQPPVPGRAGLARRSPVPVAIAGLALVAIVGTLLVIFASPSQSVERSVVAPDGRVVSIVRLPLPQVAPAPAVWVASTDVRESGDDTRTVGSVLLIASLAGVVLLTSFWLWFGTRGGPGRVQIDDRPSRPAY
jgi:hypothetical protein